MADYNLGSVADRAWQGLNDVPSSISGAVMQTIAYQAVLFTNNLIKSNIGSNAIGDIHQSPIINLTKAWTLARMANVGANYSWSIGEFSVDKGAGTNTEAVQVKMFFDMALLELKAIGRPLRWAGANL